MRRKLLTDTWVYLGLKCLGVQYIISLCVRWSQLAFEWGGSEPSMLLKSTLCLLWATKEHTLSSSLLRRLEPCDNQSRALAVGSAMVMTSHDFYLPLMASLSWSLGEIFLWFLGHRDETWVPDDYKEAKYLKKIKLFTSFQKIFIHYSGFSSDCMNLSPF